MLRHIVMPVLAVIYADGNDRHGSSAERIYRICLNILVWFCISAQAMFSSCLEHLYILFLISNFLAATDGGNDKKSKTNLFSLRLLPPEFPRLGRAGPEGNKFVSFDAPGSAELGPKETNLFSLMPQARLSWARRRQICFL